MSRLHLVAPYVEFPDAVSATEWLAVHGCEHRPDLVVMAEAKELICHAQRTFSDIRVLGHCDGRPICEFGVTSRVRVTAVGRYAEIWNVSVESPHVINLRFDHLFSPHSRLDPDCGLPKSRIFPPYLNLKRLKFSFWTASPHKFITVAWQIGQILR